MPMKNDNFNIELAPISLGDYAPSLSEYAGAAFGDAWNDNPTTVLGNNLEALDRRMGGQLPDLMEAAEYGELSLDINSPEQSADISRFYPQTMEMDTQAQYIKKEGLEGHLKPDEAYTQEELSFLADLKKEELQRADTRASSPWWMAPVGFGAGLGASFLDPLNIAAGFVPVVGQARMTSMLARQSGSAWGRAGVRAAVGAAEGAVGTALLEPMIAAGKNELQQEYGIEDSLMNIAMGAVMGGVMRPAFGALGERANARQGRRQEWEYASPTSESMRLVDERAARIWEAMQESGAEGLTLDHATAASILWDAHIRGVAYDTGASLADVNARYAVEWRAGKLETAERSGADIAGAMDTDSDTASRPSGNDPGESQAVDAPQTLPDRLESKGGQTTFGIEDAFALVEFFKAADASTAPHEIYHMFRRIMQDTYNNPNATQAARERYRRAADFVGADPDAPRWTKAQEEKFAQAGERFLLEGISPSTHMQGAFDNFKAWLTELYGEAQRSGMEISDSMRNLFSDSIMSFDDSQLAFQNAMRRLLEDEEAQARSADEIAADMDFAEAESRASESSGMSEGEAIEARTRDEELQRVNDKLDLLFSDPEDAHLRERIREEFDLAMQEADREIAAIERRGEMLEFAAECLLEG